MRCIHFQGQNQLGLRTEFSLTTIQIFSFPCFHDFSRQSCHTTQKAHGSTYVRKLNPFGYKVLLSAGADSYSYSITCSLSRRGDKSSKKSVVTGVEYQKCWWKNIAQNWLSFQHVSLHGQRFHALWTYWTFTHLLEMQEGGRNIPVSRLWVTSSRGKVFKSKISTTNRGDPKWVIQNLLLIFYDVSVRYEYMYIA